MPMHMGNRFPLLRERWGIFFDGEFRKPFAALGRLLAQQPDDEAMKHGVGAIATPHPQL